MLDTGLNSDFIPECSPIPVRHDIALYSSNEVAGPIPNIKIGSQQMSIKLDPMEPRISARSPYSGPHRKLVLAFDVGTTFSGISYWPV